MSPPSFVGDETTKQRRALMSDRIEVPIGLDDVEVTGTKLVDGQLEVSIVSTLPAACFHCGSIDVIGHGRFRRRVRDMSLGYPTLLIWSQRRLLCNDCGRSSRERHPAVSGQLWTFVTRTTSGCVGSAAHHQPVHRSDRSAGLSTALGRGGSIRAGVVVAGLPIIRTCS